MMPLQPGTRLGNYEVLAELGAGGMGEVYKAYDPRLDRDVAIKVLRDELASDPERLRRFEQEARAASALDHPNIVHIYDIAESDGVHYIVMQYVDGNTLRALLSEGPLPLQELLEYARQIAEGLAKAHAAGIIHRDLKPDNLMVTTDGYVKILDFGLAKLLPQAGVDTEAATITKEGTIAGTVMGTARYMSPEQALGKPLDARTDIFSLGSVLYEMSTGRRPFEGSTMAALFDKLLHTTPPAPSALNPQITPTLDQVIHKALEKKPSDRYPSAKEILAALATANKESAAREPQNKKSIIVLPFENMSPDPEQEYFCDGITEEIISDLSKVEALRVISRRSAMTFKGTRKKIREIANEVNVHYILEGSVRRAGQNLRITAQLIDASNDAHLWTNKYAGTLDDVFDIQEKVSRSIVDSLKVKLTPGEQKRLAERPIENTQAYECYLRAKREMRRLTEDGLDRARHDLQNGLELVGENALLYTGLAETYIYYYDFGIKVEEATLKKAQEYIYNVLTLDSNSSHSYYLLGMMARYESVLQAVPHFQKALAIDPDSPDTLFWLGAAYSLQTGKASAAKPLAEKLLEIDPLTPMNYLILGFTQWMQGNLDDALSTLEKYASLEPNTIIPRMWIVYVLAWMDQPQRAIELVDQAADPESSDVMLKNFSEQLLFFKYAYLGEKAKAIKVFSDETKKYVWADPELCWLGAGFYSLLDDKEEALRWLEHATHRGWINYPLLSKNDPFLENIRGEERFKKLMERVKYEWEHFEI